MTDKRIYAEKMDNKDMQTGYVIGASDAINFIKEGYAVTVGASIDSCDVFLNLHKNPTTSIEIKLTPEQSELWRRYLIVTRESSIESMLLNAVEAYAKLRSPVGWGAVNGNSPEQIIDEKINGAVQDD